MGVGAIKAFLTSFYVLPYFAFLSASLKESFFFFIYIPAIYMYKGSRKKRKKSSLNGRAIKGGGVKGRAI